MSSLLIAASFGIVSFTGLLSSLPHLASGALYHKDVFTRLLAWYVDIHVGKLELRAVLCIGQSFQHTQA